MSARSLKKSKAYNSVNLVNLVVNKDFSRVLFLNLIISVVR